ncbi:tyrosine-type recombinase/integrase [Acidocella aminolytica]|uniref:Integrase n=1 Tax=Acidocella aminolytica 101 = DSM 11237 TaxID=1120923 RepID=A0A0D6PLE0_9PROT|nr:site-specific integrase [Acidocella aminolytica]GAN82043.1 integrase [Acidocella aminolytica 101 = DSM 11237]GBQ42904.1 integrase [Acidocella aminolytica 101 = DSM 11237]SHE30173.1 Integrase [Acidocella aminolytica 101 = DSM 11237]
MPRPRTEKPRLEWRRGSWSIQFWVGGTRRRIATGTADEQSAKQFLADFEAKQDRAPRQLTVTQALDRYETAREDKVEAVGRLKEAARAIRRDLGHLRVDQLNQAQWDKYAAGRMTRPHRKVDPTKHVPRKVSTGTLRREFNVLRAAMRLAWKDGFLALPPNLTPPSDSSPRDRYLTKDEARALIAACITPHVKVFLSLAIFTGARKGSILALTWDRVNFVTGMIDFQEPGRRVTAKRRAVVPMNNSLRIVLEEAYKVRQSDYVVEFNGKPVPNGLRWSFARLCQRAGLTWRPTPHHLKHSVISWLAMDRIPIDQAADLVATDPVTLRRTYKKFDPAYLRSVTAALEL